MKILVHKLEPDDLRTESKFVFLVILLLSEQTKMFGFERTEMSVPFTSDLFPGTKTSPTHSVFGRCDPRVRVERLVQVRNDLDFE